MSVSYDKSKREDAKSKGRTLATLDIAGLSFQGGVTASEQGEILALYTKLNARAAAEATPAAPAAPPAA